MPLSITKLQNLLYQKGFIPTKYFIMDGSCFYIELYSQLSADTFLLYMPSNYNFTVDSHKNSTYKMKYIDMKTAENKADEYAGGEKDTLENANIELSPDKDKLEEHLESNYRHQISLNDVSDEDNSALKMIYRQMRRLRYCVQNLKYKLGVIYKNYICAIRRDDSVDCFFVKHLPRTSNKQLVIIVDLETFYEKSEKLLEDLSTVRQSIYNILERNQGMHSRVIDKMLRNRKDIATIPESTEKKKIVYDSLLAEHERLFNLMNKARSKIIKELEALDKQEPTGLQSDISRAHQKSRLEKELAKINSIQEEIGKGISILRKKRENSLINIDNIMFDNTIMWDCMLKNFTLLKEFC